jgi:hypothetical protein
VVTEHAVDKYLAITGCKDRYKAKRRLREWFRRAKRCSIPDNFKVERILNNDFKEARYYEFNQYRFVVVDGEMVTFEEKY